MSLFVPYRRSDGGAVVLARAQSLAAVRNTMTEVRPADSSATRPLRLFLLIDHLGSGGAQAILADIVERAHVDGVEVTVAYSFGSSMYTERLRRAGAEVVFLGTPGSKRRSWMHALAPVRLLRLVARVRPDVIHVHASTLPVLQARALRVRWPRLRLVFTMHANAWQLSPLWTRVLRAMVPAYDRVVTEFEGSKDELEALGVSADRITHIPFGASVREVGNDEVHEIRRLCNADEEDPVLLSVARLAPDRLLHHFIEAMPAVLTEFPRAKLVLVGDGPHEAALRDLVHRLELSDSVRFLGRRPDPAPFYRASDLYLTMTVAQSCEVGIAGWQAMLSGMPVLALEAEWARPATRVVNCEYLVRVIHPAAIASSVLALLRNHDQLRRLARDGQAYAEATRSGRAMADRYLALYRELVEPLFSPARHRGRAGAGVQ
jgi:glycosyltransferase involved in cell wall biosynthesis